LVVKELKRSHFHRIRKISIPAHLVMKREAARSWLKNAEVRASFYRRYEKVLSESGLEIPDWIIVSGVKS
jgi:hypothetical protein